MSLELKVNTWRGEVKMTIPQYVEDKLTFRDNDPERDSSGDVNYTVENIEASYGRLLETLCEKKILTKKELTYIVEGFYK